MGSARHDNTTATIYYYKDRELLFNYINNNTLLEIVGPYKA
jgi:hypothetical protein